MNIKKVLISLLLCVGIFCTSCGASADPINDQWTHNLYPDSDGSYSVGSNASPYAEGHFTNLYATTLYLAGAIINGTTTATTGNFTNINVANNGSFGNISVTNNATATYFIGDGSQLTGIEQGELMLYFLNASSSDVVARRLSSMPNDSEITLTGAALAGGNTLMGTWITDANVPNIRLLEGNLRVHVAGKQTGGTKSTQFFYEIWKCNASGVDIEKICTSEYTDMLINLRTNYRIWALANEVMFNASDRIKVLGYAYVTGGGSAPTVEAYIQGASLTRLVVPVGAVSVEKFVPYTGAVADLVYGGATLRLDGSFAPASMSNSSAVNNSIYFSTDSNTLVYKDSGGVVHDLY
jgi:hypothetical protein